MTASLGLDAYAKINWALELLGKRPDGYHEIRTLTQTVSLCDQLRVSVRDQVPPQTPPVTLSVEGDWPAPASPSNLCWKAALAFRERFGWPESVDLWLAKEVPVGSGLGGGSSDAVAVLMALSRLSGKGDTESLLELAGKLGSDTALFVRGGAALCSGRGEIVTPVPCPREYHMVLVRPDCSVSTPEAYSLLEPSDFTRGEQVAALADHLAQGAAPTTIAGSLVNTFRDKVAQRYPQIDEVVDELCEAGALGAEMTGSGSAVFGVAENDAHARDMAQRLQDRGFWVRAVRTVPAGHRVWEDRNE